MKLTYTETDWITSKLNSYDIKYQEIFDELKDHLITAIENLREQGDQRHVEILYKEVVAAQFPGFWPFDDIVKQYQEAYRQKIKQAMWACFKYYLNWQTLPVVVLMFIVGFYLPHNKTTTVTLMIVLLLSAIIPMSYGYIGGRKIKTDDGKQSLLKNYVQKQSGFLVLVCNIILNLLASLGRNWEPAAFLSPTHYAPAVFMAMMGFFFIYGLGCIRLTKQQFKLD